jgi:ribosomal protein S3
MEILNKGIYNKEFYSYITGLKIKISGRITKKKGASRSKIINKTIGSLKLNSINSFIDYGHIEKKDKNGTQSIKVFIKNSISIPFIY